MHDRKSKPRAFLTASAIGTFRACPRLYRYRYVDGIAPVQKADAPALGTAVHAALEAAWREPARRTDAAREAIDALQLDPLDRARVGAMLAGYLSRWADDAERYETLAVEQEFWLRLVNPDSGHPGRLYDLAGKIDAIVREVETNRILIVEHKTSSEDIGPGSDYWRRLSLDAQISLYFDGARALGYEVDGCLYDVLRKPVHRPYLATPPEARKYTKDGRLYASQRESDETVDEFYNRLVDAIGDDLGAYYARGAIVRLGSELAEFRRDVWHTAQAVGDCRNRQHYPRNPSACTRFGRTCEFLGVCSGQASLDDPSSFHRLPSVHPELTLAQES